MEESLNKASNKSCEAIARTINCRMLDENKINWKIVDNKWIGKRSVWTFDRRSCWLEETTLDNIKSWWLGKDADYNEVFTIDDI